MVRDEFRYCLLQEGKYYFNTLLTLSLDGLSASRPLFPSFVVVMFLFLILFLYLFVN